MMCKIKIIKQIIQIKCKYRETEFPPVDKDMELTRASSLTLLEQAVLLEASRSEQHSRPTAGCPTLSFGSAFALLSHKEGALMSDFLICNDRLFLDVRRRIANSPTLSNSERVLARNALNLGLAEAGTVPAPLIAPLAGSGFELGASPASRADCDCAPISPVDTRADLGCSWPGVPGFSTVGERTVGRSCLEEKEKEEEEGRGWDQEVPRRRRWSGLMEEEPPPPGLRRRHWSGRPGINNS